MRIKESKLRKIIEEEFFKYINEASEDEEEGNPKEPSKVDATSDNKGSDEDEEENTPTPENKPDPQKTGGDEEEKEDPADDEITKDVEADSEQDDEKSAGDSIGDELVGKTIQSITMTDDSKIMPGATEIDMQFDEMNTPLKILVQKSGKVYFYFKGLHNSLQ